ncbi:MAG: phosphoribosylanthranilate isomerase [Granulosicoccaceae bacterium]
MERTRIKVCGLTRPEQAAATAEQGVDAVGLVFYAPSSRAVDIVQAKTISDELPPFCQLVALFLDAAPELVREVIASLPIGLLQFHGREDLAYCEQFDRPYIRSVPVDAHAQAAAFEASFASARGFLYDSNVAGEAGGKGETFDWSLLNRSDRHRPGERPMILAGGLTPENVFDGVVSTRPWAVDVSSGVERAGGDKDPARVAQFVAQVRAADRQIAANAGGEI